ncbi:MAG: tail fiber domain-containing protein, partial [Bacteroidales bacterium]|nr:tail fiber domain-containing protein [Bacteroidales bacterium]
WTSPSSLAVDPANIALTDSYIFVGNTSDKAEAQPLSGDATMTNAGVLTIEPGAVTSGKILDGTIANGDLEKSNIPLSGFGSASVNVDMGGFAITTLADPTSADDAATKSYVDGIISGGNLALTDANILIGDGSGVAVAQTMSGDATMTNLGVVTIETGAINSDKILNASIQEEDVNVLTVGNAGEILSSDGTGGFVWATDNNTTYTAGDGLSLTTTTLSLKNSANLYENAVPRWDAAGTQFTNSSIWDDNAGHVLIGDDGTGTISSSYSLQVVGAFKTEQIYHSSDVRWKTDIFTIDSALTKIQNLRGVEYQWRQDEFPEKQFADGTQIGLIAQEVEAVMPELVMTDDTGYKSVEYSNLVAVLIEAIKEQQELIAAQQEKITALQSDNKSMQSEITALQTMQSQIDELQMQVTTMSSILEMLQPTVNAK